jgi:hypothetical protein
MQEDRWIYEKVDVSLIDEAEENANRMTEEEFDTLCRNIGISGLSSTPCCYRKSTGRFVMISGHHRLRACKKCGYKKIGILYCAEEELTKDEIIAIQLSHNSLHGEDDKNILKRLFSQIQSVDFKQFAHINMDEIKPIESNGLDISLMKENYTFSVVLYNGSLEDINALLMDIRELSKTSDVVLIADQEPSEEMYLNLRKELKDKNIKSASIGFAKILELAHRQLKMEEHDLGDSE